MFFNFFSRLKSTVHASRLISYSKESKEWNPTSCKHPHSTPTDHFAFSHLLIRYLFFIFIYYHKPHLISTCDMTKPLACLMWVQYDICIAIYLLANHKIKKNIEYSNVFVFVNTCTKGRLLFTIKGYDLFDNFHMVYS